MSFHLLVTQVSHCGVAIDEKMMVEIETNVLDEKER